jgi:hypothetical protein
MVNVLSCLRNIPDSPLNKLKVVVKSGTKVNKMGDSLEEYVKNCFANTFDDTKREENIRIHNELFSWMGNQNNSPYLIIRGSDAIEVKKIEGVGSIALNSSYPKAKLSSSSDMITEGCKNCEGGGSWEKDVIYAIGTVSNTNEIKYLFFVYGSIYAASDNIYNRLRMKVKTGVNQIQGISFTGINELGKVKKVDPLGITDLRIRGMWSIQHPFKVYNYINEINEAKDTQNKYTIYALIPKSKFAEFYRNDINALRRYSNMGLYNIRVKDPNNSANLVDAILIKIILQ